MQGPLSATARPSHHSQIDLPKTILQLSFDLVTGIDLKIACFVRKIGPTVLAQPLGYPWEDLASVRELRPTRHGKMARIREPGT
jgi:hypothetical protein